MHFFKMFKNPNFEDFCLLLMIDYGCVIQVTESMLSTKL